jgi:hypothetical protein
MDIETYRDPFYHTIIKNFYNKKEEELIWQEIEFLNQPGKLQHSTLTGDPGGIDKVGIFLDDLYNFRQVSNILTINRKIFNITNLFSDNPFSKYLEGCNYDRTMLSYYENDSYYKPHKDRFVLSAVTLFFKEPKKFSGGELHFDEYNYTPDLYHNDMIIFPSCETHSVSKIILDTQEDGMGRYTINQFYSFNYQK